MGKWSVIGVVVCAAVTTASADPGLFAYRPEAFESTVTALPARNGCRVYAVRYPSPLATAVPANNTVHGQLYLPQAATTDRLPAVIVLHILGGPDGPSQLVAAHLARRGIATLHLVMPFYGPRADGKHRFLSTDVELTAQSARQAVLDIRRGVDWLASRPDIDPQRIGITGISLGAQMACVAFAVDSRFAACVLMLAGGDLAKILTAGELTAHRRQEMAALGLTYESLSQKLAASEILGREGRGRLERVEGNLVLHLEGSPQEMGRQHGVLLRAHVRAVTENVLYVVGFLKTAVTGKPFVREIQDAWGRLQRRINRPAFAETDLHQPIARPGGLSGEKPMQPM